MIVTRTSFIDQKQLINFYALFCWFPLLLRFVHNNNNAVHQRYNYIKAYTIAMAVSK